MNLQFFQRNRPIPPESFTAPKIVFRFLDRSDGSVVRFVDSLNEVLEGANLVFSAHGVAPALLTKARQRQLRVIDATCPFVSRIHGKVRQFVANGRLVLLVGHRGHDEVCGVVGEAPGSVMVIENPDEAESVQVPLGTSIALVTQTTLSITAMEKTVSVLRRRFPELGAVPTGRFLVKIFFFYQWPE